MFLFIVVAHADGSKQPPSRKGEVAAHVRRCMQPPQKRQHEFATAEKQHECHAPGMRAKARGNHADNAPPSRPRTAPAKAGTRHVAPRPLRRRSPDEVQGPHTHPAMQKPHRGPLPQASSAYIYIYIYIYIYRKAFMKSEVNTGQSSDSKRLPARRTSLGATGLRASE